MRMIARIKIVTHTLGRAKLFSAVGNLETNGEGASISYPTEGDTSFLELRPSGAKMRREGENGLNAEFSVGQTTELSLSAHGSISSIPLLTHVYKPCFSVSEISCRLVYDLFLGRSVQKFSLKIQIQGISEEQ